MQTGPYMLNEKISPHLWQSQCHTIEPSCARRTLICSGTELCQPCQHSQQVIAIAAFDQGRPALLLPIAGLCLPCPVAKCAGGLVYCSRQLVGSQVNCICHLVQDHAYVCTCVQGQGPQRVAQWRYVQTHQAADFG